MTTADTESIARRYIEAVGEHRLEPLGELFDERLTAVLSGTRYDKATWLAALDGLLPVLIRNDIREVFSVGDRACVVYDFVTDAGAVRCVELLTARDGRIVDVELVMDRVAFAPVQRALSERAAPAR